MWIVDDNAGPCARIEGNRGSRERQKHLVRTGRKRKRRKSVIHVQKLTVYSVNEPTGVDYVIKAKNRICRKMLADVEVKAIR